MRAMALDIKLQCCCGSSRFSMMLWHSRCAAAAAAAEWETFPPSWCADMYVRGDDVRGMRRVQARDLGYDVVWLMYVGPAVSDRTDSSSSSSSSKGPCVWTGGVDKHYLLTWHITAEASSNLAISVSCCTCSKVLQKGNSTLLIHFAACHQGAAFMMLITSDAAAPAATASC
jgi:hypothetical protein